MHLQRGAESHKGVIGLRHKLKEVWIEAEAIQGW